MLYWQILSRFYFSFLLFRAIRFSTAEQFFLVATRCSQGHRPLIFFITLLFTVLVVSLWNMQMGLLQFDNNLTKYYRYWLKIESRFWSVTREVKCHVYVKRQTLMCTTWPTFLFTCRLLVIISTTKLVVSRIFLSRGIVLSCFYRFISVLFWEMLNLNVTFAVCRIREP